MLSLAEAGAWSDRGGHSGELSGTFGNVLDKKRDVQDKKRTDWQQMLPGLRRAVPALRHLDDQVDLDRGAQRQFGHADRAAAVTARVAEDCHQQIRRSVCHLGLLAKERR